MKDSPEEHLKKYPKTSDEINVLDYHKLVLKVFNHMTRKFGNWVRKYKQDLIQTGYVGLIKAKEKYVPERGSFLGLAYLRVTSAMQGDIAKYAKFEVNTTPVEDVWSSTGHSFEDPLMWEEMFSSVIVDYSTVVRMITDEDDRKLLVGMIEMYPYWKLRAILDESKEDHEERVSRIKGEMCNILEILYPNIL